MDQYDLGRWMAGLEHRLEALEAWHRLIETRWNSVRANGTRIAIAAAISLTALAAHMGTDELAGWLQFAGRIALRSSH